MTMTSEVDFREYRDDEVMTVLRAYRDIFGNELSDTLVDYWELRPQRQRAWSCLTTDFRSVTLDLLKRVHRETTQEDGPFRNGYDRAFADGRLRDYCIAQGHSLAEKAAKRSSEADIALGYSIGICPWTDHGLLTTWDESKNQAIIIFGHDWYPIVPAIGSTPHPVDAPLFKRGCTHCLRRGRTSMPSATLTLRRRRSIRAKP